MGLRKVDTQDWRWAWVPERSAERSSKDKEGSRKPLNWRSGCHSCDQEQTLPLKCILYRGRYQHLAAEGLKEEAPSEKRTGCGEREMSLEESLSFVPAALKPHVFTFHYVPAHRGQSVVG